MSSARVRAVHAPDAYIGKAAKAKLARSGNGLDQESVQTLWLTEEGALRVVIGPKIVALSLRSPAIRSGEDPRWLGVAVSHVVRDGVALDLSSQALSMGWHASHRGWRWTDGAGLLLTGSSALIDITVAAVAAQQPCSMALG